MLIVIGLILTYALCYNIWSSFAFPFYLDFLHYSKDEVAFASKVFGIFMTMIGIALGGYLFVRIGRLPTVLIGAILPVFGNFVYADLAEGGPHLDAVAGTIGLTQLFGLFGFDERMVRLLLAISLREYLDRHRAGGVRRLPFRHRQQALHGRAICLAVVADVPRRLARPRHRRRGVRHLRLCDGVPLDRRGGRVRDPVRAARMDAGRGRRPPRRGRHRRQGRRSSEEGAAKPLDQAARNAIKVFRLRVKSLQRAAIVMGDIVSAMIVYLAILALQIFCIVDVIRRGRNTIWIMALVFLPVASALAYFIVEILPTLQHNRHVRAARQKVVEKLDPSASSAPRNRRSTSPTRWPTACGSPTR